MVKYGYAVCMLLSLVIEWAQCFIASTSIISSLVRERRSGLQRDLSASTVFNPDYDAEDMQTAFQNVSTEYLDSLSGALSNSDDADEVQMALKKKVIKDRVGSSLGTYQVTLPLTERLGMTICQIGPGLTVSDVDLDLDTLSPQVAPLIGGNEKLITIDLELMNERLSRTFKGLVVSSIMKQSSAWDAGIRPGDVLLATSATVGDAMWPKSTFDGVRAAIASRKVVSESIEFQFRRLSNDTTIGSQTYELTLSRPIGVEVEETPDGYVQVTGFTENASKLVKCAIQTGDRILAVDSSLGANMWPVSTVAGVISACTSRLPGQSITMRFERPESTTGETVSAVMMPIVITKIPSPTIPVTKQEELLKRCRDVLRKYKTEQQQNERKSFSDKFAVPALVADKVLDAVASASVSLDAMTLCMIMNAYISCQQPVRAVRAFEAAVGLSADGSFSPATQTITGKEKGSLVANNDALNLRTASSLMRAHSLLGDVASVHRVLAAVEGKSGVTIHGKESCPWPNTGIGGSIVVDTQIYNIALSAAARGDEFSSIEDLLLLFNSMKDNHEPGGRPMKDLVSHNTVINALTRAGKVEDAFAAFYTMKRSGIKPDKFTYTSLVKACVQEGDMQELLFDMQEQGVKADLVMYNFMIRTLCEVGKWYDAKKLVTQMEASGIVPDAMTYGFLMNGLLIAKKPSACLSLFEAACAESKTILLTENVHLYTTAITAASALENHEKAFHLINRMNIAGVKPNLKTMTALMGACMSSGKFTLATEVYKQLEEPDSVAMLKGIEAFCLDGNFNEAMSILLNKESLSKLSGKQQMKAYEHLLRTSLSTTNLEVARCVFKSFLGAGFIPSKGTFHLIIEALELIPPTRKNLPFAKITTEASFDFVLFVLDSIHDRKLPCDSYFYTSVLLAGSRLGGLRRKICSLMTESRAQTVEPQSRQSQILLDENTATVLTEVSWEDLLLNYDRHKAHLRIHIRLPSLAVRIGREEMRQVLSAEQEVTYNGRVRYNTKPKTVTTSILTN